MNEAGWKELVLENTGLKRDFARARRVMDAREELHNVRELELERAVTVTALLFRQLKATLDAYDDSDSLELFAAQMAELRKLVTQYDEGDGLQFPAQIGGVYRMKDPDGQQRYVMVICHAGNKQFGCYEIELLMKPNKPLNVPREQLEEISVHGDGA